MPRFVIKSASSQYSVPSDIWNQWIKMYQSIKMYQTSKNVDEFEETIKNYFHEHPNVATIIQKSVKTFQRKPSANLNHSFTLSIQYLAQTFIKNQSIKSKKQTLRQLIHQQKYKPLVFVPASQLSDDCCEQNESCSPILGHFPDESQIDDIDPSPFIQPSANDANVCKMFLPLPDETQQSQPSSSFDIFDEFETQL